MNTFKYRIAPSFLFFILSLAGVAISQVAMAVQRIDQVTIAPPITWVNESTEITILAAIPYDPTLITSSVTLVRLNASGAPVATVGRLYDDGTNGDTVSGDSIYTGKLTVQEGQPNTLKFKVSVAYKGTMKRVLSEVAVVDVNQPPFYTPPESSKILNIDGQFTVINRAIVVLSPTSNRASAEEIAAAVNARIVGFTPSANAYLLEVPSTTFAELQNVFILLQSDTRVLSVLTEHLLSQNSATQAPSDLSNLTDDDRVAYDMIKVQDAWTNIRNANAPLHSVSVGVLDSGIDTTHPDLKPQFGLEIGIHEPPPELDACGASNIFHGTSVSGIIAGTNKTAWDGISEPSEMNGILGGLRWEDTKETYKLHVKNAWNSNFAFNTATDEFAQKGVKVINMSFGETKCKFGQEPESCNSCTSDEFNWFGITGPSEFDKSKALYEQTIQKYKDKITFVAAAGNEDISVENILPAGIESSNVITVAASQLKQSAKPITPEKLTPENYERALWTSCPWWNFRCDDGSSAYGDGVDIAAPGSDVYAPISTKISLSERDRQWFQPVDGDLYIRNFGGTSAAAPMVTGVAGMLYALNPLLTPTEIRERIQNSGDAFVTDKPIGKHLNAAKAALFGMKADIFFLVDTTGSFGDDLKNLNIQATSIIGALQDSGLDVQFGLGHFEDYPISPWGDINYGDKAYTLAQDISPAVVDSSGKLNIISAISALGTKSGNDTPEAQLVALYQAANGKGQDVPPLGASPADIPSGSQVTFRPGAVPLIILWTDARFHKFGDAGSFPYPGPSMATTIAELNKRKIKVIGMAGGNDALSDLNAVAQGTNTLAPDNVDCDDNGSTDVSQGQPLVCRISSTGSGIGKAIVSAVFSFLVGTGGAP